jgi:hypothetical protein
MKKFLPLLINERNSTLHSEALLSLWVYMSPGFVLTDGAERRSCNAE